MALKPKAQPNNNNFVEQKPIEPAVYPSRIVQIIDLGLQALKPYKGEEKKPANQIMLTYELVDEFMMDEDGNPIMDKPRWVSEIIPFYSLKSERAKSTQRYYAIDPEEKFDGDFSMLADIPINVTIAQNLSGGKVYANVSNVGGMRSTQAAACPPLQNPVKIFILDDPDMEVFNSLPQWIQDKIKSNLNYKGSALEKALTGAMPTKGVEEAPGLDEEDENPY